MKKIRINVGKVGVITRNGDYKKVLTAGVYWVGLRNSVITFKMDEIYVINTSLNIMLNDEKFRNLVEIIEVKDSEIALIYNEDNFNKILTSGRYFFFKGLTNYNITKVDLNNVEVRNDIDLLTLQKDEVKIFVSTFKIEVYEEGLLLIDGKFIKKLEKGTYNFWKSVKDVNVLISDLRQLQMEISGQEILTRDKAALRVNFFTQYRIIDSETALLKNKEFEKQLYILIQLALREFIGTLTLDELLDKKEAVSIYVKENLIDKAKILGIELLDAGIRDVILPGDVKEIMNQVLVAQKKAQANIITRREETASTRNLLNTAKLMEDNNMLFKLKEMEYVEKIAEKIGEITVSGGGQVIDQLKGLFAGSK